MKKKKKSKKAEHRRTDAFELWYWRRLLRVPWTARRSNQSILKEISPEYSWEGLMLKLKLQYFGHLMRRTDLFEMTLMLGKIEGGRIRGWQRIRWLDGVTNAMVWVCITPGVGDRQGGLSCCGPWGCKESVTTELLNWTELNWFNPPIDLRISLETFHFVADSIWFYLEKLLIVSSHVSSQPC